MADISAAFRLWSRTAGSNSPQGTTTVGTGLAPNLQQIQATIRQYMASPATAMASATTVDLSTADGSYISITGTNTITSLGTESAGIEYILVFAGALTLTYNATSLIIPGAVNKTTVAGDIAYVVSLGSGNWKVILYQPFTVTGTGSTVLAASPTFTGTVTTAAISGTTGTFTGAVSAGESELASGTNSSGITVAALEIRELNRAGAQTGVASETPRIGFNWSGRIAAQLGMDATGVIRTFDNPGTGYASFACSTLAATGGQIAFPATAVPSANVNTIDDYYEYTAPSTACTGALTVAVIWKATKTGNMVTLTLPDATQTSPTATTSFSYGALLPSSFRPLASTHYVMARIIDNTVDLQIPGLVIVGSNGVISIFKDATGSANFIATGIGGLRNSLSVSWTI